MMRYLIVFLLTLMATPAGAQHPLNIPDFCLGSPDTVAAGQTRVITGTVTADCLRVETGGTLRLSPGATLNGSTIFGLPGARLEAGTEAAPITVLTSIVIRNTPLEPAASDPEQFGHGLIWFGVIRIHGAAKTPFVRAASEPLAGQTTLALGSAPSGWTSGDRLLIPGTSQVWDADESETPRLQTVNGSTATLQAALAGAHRGAKFVDGTQAFLPHVGNLTRTVVIRSENPAGVRGHVLVADRADVDIRYAAFLDLGRTTTDPLGPGNQLGRYSLHLHHLFGPTSPQPNGYQYTLIGNVIERGTKWGITIHNAHFGLVQDNVAYQNGGAQIMTEDGSETGNLIEGNLMVGATGPSTDENQIHLGREQSGLWLRGPRNLIRHNVVAHLGGNAFVLVNASGPSNVGGIATIPTRQGANPHIEGTFVDNAQAPLAEWIGNEFYSTRWGVILWDLLAACCTEVHEGPTSTIRNMAGWHVRSYGIFPYATNRLTLDGWTLVNDAAFADSSLGASGTYFGDYLSRHFILRRSRIENFHNGIFPPIKAGDTRDIYGSAPGTVLVEDATLRNFVNLLSTMPYGVTGGGPWIPPRVITFRRVTSEPLLGGEHVHMEYDLEYGPKINAVVLQRVIAEDVNGDDFEVFYSQQDPAFITPQSESVPGLVGSPVAGETNAQNWAARQISVAGAVAPCTTTAPGFTGFRCASTTAPVNGLPSVSTITQIGTQETNPQGQQLWKLQSVESPNWDAARWGTDTHRFNVVVQPGAGPLPVYLELHSAGDNGYHEPAESFNSTEPAIHILPVDIGYFDGLIDPATGQQRFYSKWSGYRDANGFYQPVTSDRVVRYVQWVLAQTAKWTPDTTRVYVRGQSMGGGGAQHIGLQYPATFAGVVSSTGWIDTTAWAVDRGDCLPGVRWKAATGPLCTEMLDSVYLVPRLTGVRPTLFLTWNSNDTFVNPARYPAFIQAVEASVHGHQSEWRQDDHNPFALPGLPHLVARVGAPVPVTTPSGSSLTAPTGSRTNLSSAPPTDPDTDGDGVTDSLDKCAGTPLGTPVDATGCPVVPPQPATITVNPSVRHQVMHYWEAGVIASVSDWASLTDAQIGAMLDLAVTDMGLTRARLAVRSGVEGPGDRYDIVNDNGDPNILNDTGFTWTNFDLEVSRWIVPARQRAQARGEPFYVNLNYVDFGQSAFEHYQNPAEYAEFMLAVWRHMQQKFGFVPNAIEVILEPDNQGGVWTGDVIGRVMVATAQRFQHEGLAVPEFIAPSVVAMPNAMGYLDAIYAVPGAQALLTEVSYHRYNMAGDLAALAERARVDGKRMAMLEFWSISTDHTLLYQDLTEGRNSAWQPGIYGDAFGCQFGQTVAIVNGVATICPKNWTVRQYTKYVRPGAQRIDAASTNPTLKPLAFINASGASVVAVMADAAGSFSVAGLPAGTYSQSYAAADGSNTGVLPNVTISSGQNVSTSIPVAGVLTIAGVGGGPPPDPDTDGDGVKDSLDKCANTPAGTPVDANGCPLPPPPDTTAPVVTLVVAPSPLGGTVHLTATCADNVGCVQVDLFIDGALRGTDTTAPYDFAVDTVTLANTAHTFTVVGRDAAGNAGPLATPEIRTVDNAVPSPGQFTVTSTISTCRYTARDVPPTTAIGWAVQFQRRNGSAGAWENHGSKRTSPPYERSATLTFAPWEFQAVWTKAGIETVTRPVLVPGCPR